MIEFKFKGKRKIKVQPNFSLPIKNIDYFGTACSAMSNRSANDAELKIELLKVTILNVIVFITVIFSIILVVVQTFNSVAQQSIDLGIIEFNMGFIIVAFAALFIFEISFIQKFILQRLLYASSKNSIKLTKDNVYLPIPFKQGYKKVPYSDIVELCELVSIFDDKLIIKYLDDGQVVSFSISFKNVVNIKKYIEIRFHIIAALFANDIIDRDLGLKESYCFMHLVSFIRFRDSIIYQILQYIKSKYNFIKLLFKNGKYERDGYSQNKVEEWFRFGKLHRINGPARITEGENKEWYRYGLLHRDGGPAIYGGPNIYDDGVMRRGTTYQSAPGTRMVSYTVMMALQWIFGDLERNGISMVCCIERVALRK